jgi:hypothetical protein
VGHVQQVHRLEDPPVVCERSPQAGDAALGRHHPDQVISPHLIGDQRSGDLKHVRPMLLDRRDVHPPQVQLVQPAVPIGRR